MLALSEIKMMMPSKNFSTMYGFSCLKQAASVPSPLYGADAGAAETFPENSKWKWKFSKDCGCKIRSLRGLPAPGVTDEVGQWLGCFLRRSVGAAGHAVAGVSPSHACPGTTQASGDAPATSEVVTSTNVLG